AMLPTAENVGNIAPLWRAFWSGGSLAPWSSWSGSLSRIANRLLQLCNTREGLRELQVQNPPKPALVFSLSKLAYPFPHGLRPDSNLPVLLMAVQLRGQLAEGVNSLVDAIGRDDPYLLTLERDHRRRAKQIFLFWPARVVFVASYLYSAVVLVRETLNDGWAGLSFHAGNLWSNLLFIVPLAVSALIAL